MDGIFHTTHITVLQGPSLHDKYHVGLLQKDASVHLSFLEAAYLIDRDKLTVYKNKKKLNLITYATKKDKQFLVRFLVYKNLKDRGYIVQTGLKFGAEFRVYDKGVKPGKDHAKWIVYPVYETEKLTWFDFSAKNRVAHSTKKKLLIAIVDAEHDVTYYEIQWQKP